jgi:hypothetical protein
VTADVDDRRLELAEQIERLGRPSGHELEAVAEAAALPCGKAMGATN